MKDFKEIAKTALEEADIRKKNFSSERNPKDNRDWWSYRTWSQPDTETGKKKE